MIVRVFVLIMFFIIQITILDAKINYDVVTMKKLMSASLLKNTCESEREINQGVCIGYLMGIADSLSSSEGLFGIKACMPDGVTVTILKVLTLQEIKNHQEWLELAAGPIVAHAFAIKYPC